MVSEQKQEITDNATEIGQPPHEMCKQVGVGGTEQTNHHSKTTSLTNVVLIGTGHGQVLDCPGCILLDAGTCVLEERNESLDTTRFADSVPICLVQGYLQKR